MATLSFYDPFMAPTKLYEVVNRFLESGARKMLVPRAKAEYKNAQSQRNSLNSSIKRYGRSCKAVIENDEVYLVRIPA